MIFLESRLNDRPIAPVPAKISQITLLFESPQTAEIDERMKFVNLYLDPM